MSCNVIAIINFLFGLIYSIYARKMIHKEIFSDENKSSSKNSVLSNINENDDLKSAKELKILIKDELVRNKFNSKEETENDKTDYYYDRMK